MLQSTGDHFEGALTAPPAAQDISESDASGLSQRPLTRAPNSPRLARYGETAPQRGVTGIETAIIMISFIIVASVFAMTTLNTGLFAADETESTVLGGLKKASASLAIRGSVHANRSDVDVDGNEIILITSTSTDQYAVSTLTFIVSGTVPGNVVDLTPPYTTNGAGTDPDASGLESRSTAAYVSEDTRISELAWSVNFVGTNDGDYILEGREKAEITIWLQQNDITNGHWELGTDASDPFIDTAAELLQAKTEFTVQLDTGGGIISISHGIPSAMDAVMNLN